MTKRQFPFGYWRKEKNSDSFSENRDECELRLFCSVVLFVVKNKTTTATTVACLLVKICNFKCYSNLAWISSDYFESLLLPQLLRGENDSKQSDDFRLTRIQFPSSRNWPKMFLCKSENKIASSCLSTSLIDFHLIVWLFVFFFWTLLFSIFLAVDWN